MAAKYPTAVATDADLLIAKNHAQTTLVGNLNSSDTTFTLASDAFGPDVAITIDSEIILILTKSGVTVSTSIRGFDGTAAASHVSGRLVSAFVDAIHHNSLSAEVQALETALGIGMANITSLIPNPMPVNKGGTGGADAATARTNLGLALPLPLASGGTGGTDAATARTALGLTLPLPLSAGGTSGTDAASARTAIAAAKSGANSDITSLSAIATPLSVGQGGTGDATLTGIVLGTGATALSGVAGTQRQQLRVKPNQSAVSYEFVDPMLVNAADYNYPAQTPGGSLAIGNNTITLTPVPLGVNWNDPRLKLWISGGTGAAESVPVVVAGPGTATSGASSGTVTITCANTHTGAWTVSSPFAGIYEAVAANPGKEVRIPAGTYIMKDGLNFDPAKPLLLTGDGSGSTGTTTFLNFAALTTAINAISITDTSYSNTEPKVLRRFQLQGTGTTSGGHGIALTKVTRVILDGVQVNSFALSGIWMSDAFEITITGGCASLYNGQWGVSMQGTCNLNRIERSYVGNNSRSNGFGSVLISGISAIAPSQSITLDGADLSNSGALPFTSVTTAYGLFAQYVTGLTICNCYNEGNITNAELLQGGIQGVTQYNNWYNSAPVTYASDVTGVVSWGNTFNGAAAVRSFLNPSLAGYVIGPDHSLAGSGESAAHPHMLGSVSSISLTGAFSAATVANYIATETGANNAIAGALLDQSGGAVPLAAGLVVTVKLAHTLQAGADTFALNGTAKNIKSSRNAANNIAVAYAATGVITLIYDGVEWLDVSQ